MTNPKSPAVTGSPDAIWLIYGELEHDDTHANCAREGEVLWCENPQFPADVKYVRADCLAALEAERDEAKKALALVQQHHATAWNRGHEAGMRASRDTVRQANEAVQRDAWGNTQLTEALLAAEAERDRLAAEVEALRVDAELLDWLSDSALSMDAVADPDNLTVVFYGTDPCRQAYGRTLRAAVRAAIDASRGKG